MLAAPTEKCRLWVCKEARWPPVVAAASVPFLLKLPFTSAVLELELELIQTQMVQPGRKPLGLFLGTHHLPLYTCISAREMTSAALSFPQLSGEN